MDYGIRTSVGFIKFTMDESICVGEYIDIKTSNKIIFREEDGEKFRNLYRFARYLYISKNENGIFLNIIENIYAKPYEYLLIRMK